MSVLSTSLTPVSSHSWHHLPSYSASNNNITHSNSNITYSNNNITHSNKQKLKHVMQHNSPTNIENALVNGHVSMVTTSSSPQGTYKDVHLDSEMNHRDPCDSYKHDRKQKLRVNEDCSPEEKRQRFLERNRAAAARCRQKRKIWVTQLESKSDDLIQTNNSLVNEINALHSEVAQLKALLLAHKDCPVTIQQNSR